MCGRSARPGSPVPLRNYPPAWARSPLLAALLLLASAPAIAKTQNFGSGVPFGIGFAGGFEPRPANGFVTAPTTASFYSHYFAFEPFFDLVNVVFRPSVAYHFFPRFGGSGTDALGSYTESSKVGSFDYGLRVQLAPYVAKNMRSRAFFTIGAWKSATRARNSRAYASGANFSESVRGSGTTVNVGLGAETFLLQNYSLQLEGGYTQRSVDSFGYFSTVDVTGTARSEGATVLDGNFRRKAVHLWGPYLQLALNLNF